MSLYISSLNSGSNANCYYVGNQQEAVLIDAGLSCRETEKRMKKLGLSINKIKAIFVSHEHADHISGISSISKKYQIPVYITPKTLAAIDLPIEPHLVCSFTVKKAISIGSLSVIPFLKIHDAVDPHSFIIKGNGVTIGVITDIGHACEQVIHYFKQCNAVFLEANYCEQLLQKSSYPYHLKQRISSNEGHLSNTQALELLLKHKGTHLNRLILSHLSKNNNTHTIVEELFTENAGTVNITIASRYTATSVYEIHTGNSIATVQKPTQLQLF
jgi:phosphoribosyl 1,2-cyclic phosphodiesterase